MICCMAIWVGVYGAKLEVPPEGTDLEAGGEAGTDGGGEAKIGVECTCLQRGCLNCDTSEALRLDLRTGIIYGSLTGVSVHMEPTEVEQHGESDCCYAAVLRAEFERALAEDCRNLLQISMNFDTDRGGWLFNFGDSVSNNGYGGDGSDQSRDCEIYGLNDDVTVFSNDHCQSAQLASYPGATSSAVGWADFLIGNEFYQISNSAGTTDEFCSHCLYALNGQNDTQGAINQDVYLGFNRVVSTGSSRTGWGVCDVFLNWVCPCEVLS